MQKARQNTRIKWMLEDLIHEINGINNVGWQRPRNKKVIDHFNRDRVGGHGHSNLKIRSVENMFSDEVGTAQRKSIKKVNRKAQRRNHKKVIAEGYLDSVFLNEDIQDYVRFNNLCDEEWEYFDDYDYEDFAEYDDFMEGYIEFLDYGDETIEDCHDRWDHEEQAWFEIEMGYHDER